MNLTGRLTLVLSGCISVARIMVLQMKEQSFTNKIDYISSFMF
jgi:hypothetical protein